MRLVFLLLLSLAFPLKIFLCLGRIENMTMLMHGHAFDHIILSRYMEITLLCTWNGGTK